MYHRHAQVSVRQRRRRLAVHGQRARLRLPGAARRPPEATPPPPPARRPAATICAICGSASWCEYALPMRRVTSGST